MLPCPSCKQFELVMQPHQFWCSFGGNSIPRSSFWWHSPRGFWQLPFYPPRWPVERKKETPSGPDAEAKLTQQEMMPNQKERDDNLCSRSPFSVCSFPPSLLCRTFSILAASPSLRTSSWTAYLEKRTRCVNDMAMEQLRRRTVLRSSSSCCVALTRERNLTHPSHAHPQSTLSKLVFVREPQLSNQTRLKISPTNTLRNEKSLSARCVIMPGLFNATQHENKARFRCFLCAKGKGSHWPVDRCHFGSPVKQSLTGVTRHSWSSSRELLSVADARIKRRILSSRKSTSETWTQNCCDQIAWSHIRWCDPFPNADFCGSAWAGKCPLIWTAFEYVANIEILIPDNEYLNMYRLKALTNPFQKHTPLWHNFAQSSFSPFCTWPRNLLLLSFWLTFHFRHLGCLVFYPSGEKDLKQAVDKLKTTSEFYQEMSLPLVMFTGWRHHFLCWLVHSADVADWNLQIKCQHGAAHEKHGKAEKTQDKCHRKQITEKSTFRQETQVDRLQCCWV